MNIEDIQTEKAKFLVNETIDLIKYANSNNFSDPEIEYKWIKKCNPLVFQNLTIHFRDKYIDNINKFEQNPQIDMLKKFYTKYKQLFKFNPNFEIIECNKPKFFENMLEYIKYIKTLELAV